MAIQYKQRCCLCRKNYAMVTRKDRYAICYDCQKKQMRGEITDPGMKKLFDIPEDYYKKSMFLRNIKINYLKYGKLTDKQISAFKKVTKKLKESA